MRKWYSLDREVCIERDGLTEQPATDRYLEFSRGRAEFLDRDEGHFERPGRISLTPAVGGPSM
jgi:hypothetical protein